LSQTLKNTLTGSPDFENEFVSIKESPDTFGILPDWWMERCSDLNDADEPDDGGPLVEEEIFERLTGEQLKMY